MIIDSLKDEHKLETKTLHDKLERKKSKILNIKQESDIIQVDYERFKSQSKQDGDSQRGFQESIKALELENKHLKESLSLLQEERGKMLSTQSVELNEIRELNSEENLKLQKNIQMLTEEKEVTYSSSTILWILV